MTSLKALLDFCSNCGEEIFFGYCDNCEEDEDFYEDPDVELNRRILDEVMETHPDISFTREEYDRYLYGE